MKNSKIFYLNSIIYSIKCSLMYNTNKSSKIFYNSNNNTIDNFILLINFNDQPKHVFKSF